MIWDGDDSRNDILSDDSLEHNGNDKEIANNVCQLLGQTAPAQREWGDSYLYSSAERASVDFEHSARICNGGDQRERGGPHACGVRRVRRGRGRSTSQLRGCGRGAHFSVCMRCECHNTLVNLFLFFHIQ